MCFEFPALEQEPAQLERTPNMIDHPVRGSKDIADCLAAVVHHVEEGLHRSELEHTARAFSLAPTQAEKL